MNKIKPLILFCGLMGTGKTSLSNHYSKKILDYVKIDRDDVRRILGIKVFDRKDTDKVNEFTYSKAKEIIKNGGGVILDSAYKSKEAREKVYRIANDFKIPVLVIECVCKPETSIKRISSRPAKDDLHTPTNDPEVYNTYARMWENPFDDLKDTKNNHVSLAKINTDDYTLKRIKIQGDYIELIEEILSIIEGNLENFKNSFN